MKTAHLVGMLLVPLLVDSCEWDGFQADLSIGPFGEETRKVLLLYEAGFNSLGSDIRNNIETLKEGYLPGNRRNDDILLILSHVTESGWNYTRETSPVLPFRRPRPAFPP